jgi:hypothetical protein
MLVEDSDLVDCNPATFDANSERYEILAENVQYTDVTLGGNGLTGGIDPIFAHLRPGTRVVFGRILMEVGPTELDFWLPRILGNDPTPATDPQEYTTSEVFDLKPFDIMMQRDQGTVIYRHLAVQSAVLRARASIEGDEQIMQLGINVIGYEEHDGTGLWPDPEPALPTDVRLYWLLGDGTLTLDTDNPNAQEEYYFDAFNLLFNNNLQPLVRNFLRITCLQSRGRDIRLQTSTPYTSDSHSKLYINRFAGAGVLKFQGTKNLSGTAQSTYETIFTFPNLYQTRRTPQTSGPGEIPLSLDLQAYRDGANEPIVITNTV